MTRLVLKDYDYDAPSQRWYVEPVSGSGERMESSASYTGNGSYLGSVTDNRGNTASYSYDENRGTLQSVTENNGTPEARTTSYTYHSANDRIETTSRGDVSTWYGYDSAGRMNAISHNNFSYGFSYDRFGNVTQTRVGDQALMTNTYNGNNGKLQKAAYGNGDEIRYTYDNLGRVTRQTDQYDNGTSYVYDNAGRLIRTMHDRGGEEIWTDYNYDSIGKSISTVAGHPLRKYTCQRKAGASLFLLMTRMMFERYSCEHRTIITAARNLAVCRRSVRVRRLSRIFAFKTHPNTAISRDCRKMFQENNDAQKNASECS